MSEVTNRESIVEEPEEPLSVSAALALAKGALEGVSLRLMGEVSEVSIKRGYKAVYFSVKDENSTLPCQMWFNRYDAAGVPLEVGMLVELAGNFSLYAAKGRMSFNVKSITLAGEGKLRLQVANLAKKLRAEGLMDKSRKKPLPAYPQRIGVVTSPRGKAVHDALRTLRERFPAAEVKLAGVPVEGVNAAANIINGMRCVYKAGVDVILLVRGGGSFEDYMPFNDEALARAIAACPTPVVTGIGHEPDTCIADMVADVRASTPTGAAEAVVPTVKDVANMLAMRERALHLALQRVCERRASALRRLAERPIFVDRNVLFAAEAQGLDYAAERLSRALPTSLQRDGAALEALGQRLHRAIPYAVARDRAAVSALKTRFATVMPQAGERYRSHLDALRTRTLTCGKQLIPRFGTEMAHGASRLNDLSPLTVLGRGYAMARNEAGAVVKDIEQAPVGSELRVTVANGELSCEVKEAKRITTEVMEWKE